MRRTVISCEIMLDDESWELIATCNQPNCSLVKKIGLKRVLATMDTLKGALLMKSESDNRLPKVRLQLPLSSEDGHVVGSLSFTKKTVLATVKFPKRTTTKRFSSKLSSNEYSARAWIVQEIGRYDGHSL